MKVYLNRIDGIDDAILTMLLSKRHLTREEEMRIRDKVRLYSATKISREYPLGALCGCDEELHDWLTKLFGWGWTHITLPRFIDLSFTVYGLHRGGQDDLDAHSMRMNNRIIRESTRLGDFKEGEMSEWYQGKIIPTDIALAHLGINVPKEIEHDGQIYVKGVNGYILKGHENDKDYKRGLLMLSIPSCFIFRMNLTEYAHMYKERNENGSANPEVKIAAEDMTDQVEKGTLGFANREWLLKVKN